MIILIFKIFFLVWFSIGFLSAVYDWYVQDKKGLYVGDVLVFFLGGFLGLLTFMLVVMANDGFEALYNKIQNILKRRIF